jgi:hypothetical protein
LKSKIEDKLLKVLLLFCFFDFSNNIKENCDFQENGNGDMLEKCAYKLLEPFWPVPNGY